MKTISILALAAPVAAFTTQNNVARQSTTQISETKVRCVVLRWIWKVSRVLDKAENSRCRVDY